MGLGDDYYFCNNVFLLCWVGASAGSPIATEQYWTLLEEMRAEYLADLEEYVGYARMNDRNPQPSDKMSKMLNIVARLSVRFFCWEHLVHQACI